MSSRIHFQTATDVEEEEEEEGTGIPLILDDLSPDLQHHNAQTHHKVENWRTYVLLPLPPLTTDYNNYDDNWFILF